MKFILFTENKDEGKCNSHSIEKGLSDYGYNQFSCHRTDKNQRKLVQATIAWEIYNHLLFSQTWNSLPLHELQLLIWFIYRKICLTCTYLYLLHTYMLNACPVHISQVFFFKSKFYYIVFNIRTWAVKSLIWCLAMVINNKDFPVLLLGNIGMCGISFPEAIHYF